MEGLWEAIIVPNNTKSPRTELLLSYSCTAESNASGCDPNAVSIYNSTGDPVRPSPPAVSRNDWGHAL